MLTWGCPPDGRVTAVSAGDLFRSAVLPKWASKRDTFIFGAAFPLLLHVLSGRNCRAGFPYRGPFGLCSSPRAWCDCDLVFLALDHRVSFWVCDHPSSGITGLQEGTWSLLDSTKGHPLPVPETH